MPAHRCQKGPELCGSSAHLELGCLVEIGSTDTLSDNVPVSTTRGQAHPLLHHDILELGPYLPNLEQDTDKTGWSPPLHHTTPSSRLCPSGLPPHLPHGLGMDEMVIAPDGRVIIVLPLQVDIQVSQMVTFRDSKLLPDLIALLLSALGKETGTFKYRHREARPIVHIPRFSH